MPIERHRSDHATLLRCRAGQSPFQVLAGDIGLVYDHTPSIVHDLIHARERHIYGATEWANLTHTFCVLGSSGTIIEAESEGMQVANISKYHDADYWLISVDATASQRALCRDRWLGLKGLPYDFLTFVSEAMLCFGFPFSLRSVDKRFICSGAACYGALAYVVDFPTPWDEMTPADIGMFFKVPIAEPPAPLSFFGRILDRVVTVGRLIASPFHKKGQKA